MKTGHFKRRGYVIPHRFPQAAHFQIGGAIETGAANQYTNLA